MPEVRAVMRVWGVRTTWRTVEDGDFFCAGCGGDRNYRRRTGRRRFTVLGIPLLPRGAASPIVECSSCHARFGSHVLNTPTTTRFSAMLRDAVHTVALAAVVAGGAGDRTVREAVIGVLRGAGFEDRTAEQLLTLVERLTAGTRQLPGSSEDGPAGGTIIAIELGAVLEPLAPHLAPPGRESILLQGARIALADGPYTPVERQTLTAVGRALLIGHDDTERLLAAAARTPS